jgi:hypothetical protein
MKIMIEHEPAGAWSIAAMLNARNHSRYARRNLAGNMTAAVLYGREDVRIEQVPVPRGTRRVDRACSAALTCGTDLKVFRRGYHAKMIQPPALFGHEAGRSRG